MEKRETGWTNRKLSPLTSIAVGVCVALPVAFISGSNIKLDRIKLVGDPAMVRNYEEDLRKIDHPVPNYLRDLSMRYAENRYNEEQAQKNYSQERIPKTPEKTN